MTKNKYKETKMKIINKKINKSTRETFLFCFLVFSFYSQVYFEFVDKSINKMLL